MNSAFRPAVPHVTRQNFGGGREAAKAAAALPEEYSPGHWALLREEFFLHGVEVVEATFGWRKTQAYEACAAWGWHAAKAEWKIARARRARDLHNQEVLLRTWGWAPGDWAIEVAFTPIATPIGVVGVGNTPGPTVLRWMRERGLRKYLLRWEGVSRSVPTEDFRPGSSITVIRDGDKLEFPAARRLFKHRA